MKAYITARTRLFFAAALTILMLGVGVVNLAHEGRTAAGPGTPLIVDGGAPGTGG